MGTELMESGGGEMPAVIEQAQSALADGQAMQQVKTSYATAISVQKPRTIAAVQNRLLDEAMMAGDTAYYGWGAGKDKIEGPSIKLAMLAARCWGNCATEMQPVQETSEAWVFTAAFVDLETGFTCTRQFRQSKTSIVYGKHDKERKTDIRFQIGQSKAIRNAIVNAVPGWLIDKAIEKAKEGVRTKIARYIKENGTAAAASFILSGLAKEGVTEDRVLDKCGVAKSTALDIDNIVQLRGDLTALQLGQETAEVLFPIPDEGGALAGDLEKAAEAKAAGNPKPDAEDDPEPTPDDDGKAADRAQRADEYRQVIGRVQTAADVANIRGLLGDEELLPPPHIAAMEHSLNEAAKALNLKG